jgi:hypothetical protein
MEYRARPEHLREIPELQGGRERGKGKIMSFL